ncbi:endonuclease/exonuclease/phosphatase family protein [Microbacterium sp. HD4P20]|uniref:endonuclease/exonuclease/phosphatase family protein n=1 Tax=Microbacterium sp. HD4P20 TaxID=2864874 RepID=UPI001C6436C0|nr:endonuclease/exonuclease/phosphatase family protein [Microbacterium sp. HD4P20]MCP2636445.1 endonuclease/exonuclease/phosphatase family protein [Microbacterium sp. HD4P20]
MTLPLIGPIAPPGLHVMTFNIRRRMDGLAWRRADRWRHRLPAVRALLASEQPTLLGVQEAMPDQADDVLAALGRRYRFVGHGRGARRTGEGCPLYFDSGRLELLEWEQIALSDHPHHAGSRSWGNLIPRVAVTARFRDRSTNSPFLALNTHLDPFSRRSRLRAVDALRALIGDGPAILTGDLNAREGSRTLRELLSDGSLKDAWATAARRVGASVGTFPNYRPARAGAHRIDWIIVTPDVGVERAGINARRFDGRWPSDHLPVQAVVRLDGEGRSA